VSPYNKCQNAFFQLTEDTEDTEGKQELEFETDVEVKNQSKISTC
jgi:hypothetical protein